MCLPVGAGVAPNTEPVCALSTLQFQTGNFFFFLACSPLLLAFQGWNHVSGSSRKLPRSLTLSLF